MPAVFVFLWGTGFIGAKLGLPSAEPMTFLSLRFTLVAAAFFAFVLIVRAPWPSSWTETGHIAVVGLLLHGVYLGGVFASIDRGVEAGVSALIVGAQPLLTAIAAGPVLGERVTLRQWLGLLLGFAGVTLVVWQKLQLGLGTPLGMGLSILALLGITAGTLYQKRFCADMPLRSGNAIQFAAAAAATGLLAFTLETRVIDWTPEFIFAMAWLVILLSFGAVTLLIVLIRRGAASRVASLFFLVPPTTAVAGWLVFGERFGPLALGGMALVVVGVALVNLAPRPAGSA
ncbi:MAG: DMT family transporter [Kiloniellales bacterium]|nr:DMT family transporter [Kiloniellales bacterium]